MSYSQIIRDIAARAAQWYLENPDTQMLDATLRLYSLKLSRQWKKPNGKLLNLLYSNFDEEFVKITN